MIPAVPAGSITYILKPRDALPKVADFTARIDSSLGGGGLPAEKVQEIGDSIVSATADGTSTVAACLQARCNLSRTLCSISRGCQWTWERLHYRRLSSVK